MKLVPISTEVIEAANRLQELDNQRTAYNQNKLYVAFGGGLGAKIRNRVVEDLAIVLTAVTKADPL